MANKKKLPPFKEVLREYDKSFPDHKRAWRRLANATQDVGWKDIYYMILRLQELTNDTSAYRVRRNPNAH